MADFNRGNRFNKGGKSGGFKRRDFTDRFSRGPVEMHKAVCDNCGKDCEVPFRPTSGKPVFCSNCFEKREPSGSRNPSQEWSPRRSSEERQMYEAVCDNCGKDCKIPFRPSNGRPVYCSDCFEKGDNAPRSSENKDGGQSRDTQQPQYGQQIQELNAKLDKILALLTPSTTLTETTVEDIIEKAPKVKKEKKPSKKTKLPVSK